MNQILFLVILWSLSNTFLVLLKNDLLKHVDIEATFLINNFMVTFLLLLYCIFYKGLSLTINKYKKVLTNNTVHLQLWILSVVYILFSFVNNYLLSYNDVSYIVMISNISYLFAITIMSSYYNQIAITGKKWIALMLLSVSLYLLNS